MGRTDRAESPSPDANTDLLTLEKHREAAVIRNASHKVPTTEAMPAAQGLQHRRVLKHSSFLGLTQVPKMRNGAFLEVTVAHNRPCVAPMRPSGVKLRIRQISREHRMLVIRLEVLADHQLVPV